jgi:hypothetical protein
MATPDDVAPLSTPTRAAAVYLRNRIAVRVAEQEAEEWLVRLWGVVEAECRTRLDPATAARWRVTRQETQGLPLHGIAVETRDFLPEFRERAAAQTKAVTLYAIARDARYDPTLNGDQVRVWLSFNSNEAARTVANVGAANGDQSFRSRLDAVRSASGRPLAGGDAALGCWDVQLEFGVVDAERIARSLLASSERAWNELLRPLL